MKQPVPKHPKCPAEYVESVRQDSEQAFDFARENLKESAVHQERLYNRRVDIRSYQPGDWVWRWYPPSAKVKLGKGWTGPYMDHLKRYVADEYPNSWLGVQVEPHGREIGNVDEALSSGNEDRNFDNGQFEGIELLDVPVDKDPLPVLRHSKRVIKPPDRLSL